MDTWIEEASMMIFIEAAAERRFNKTLSVERIAEIINREFNRSSHPQMIPCYNKDQ